MNPVSSPPQLISYTDYRLKLAEIRQLPSDGQRREALKPVHAQGRATATAFLEQSLLKALNDTTETESLIWFWFNHFNVFWLKGLSGPALPLYVEQAIRPHIQGKFRELLLATMTQPLMIIYLDNFFNYANKINENYARELLELHTLGVDGGYTQKDVQEVARLLTGFGLRPLPPVTQWPAKFAPLVKEQGEFMFDPRRHDFGSKQILGHKIEGSGYTELEQLADILTQHPATAQHIARKLCLYLVGEQPDPKLVKQAAQTFSDTQGDLAAVITFIQQQSSRLPAQKTFKDPYRWVTSSIRLLATGRPIQSVGPALQWLNTLGQPLFGRHTPDGYSLKGTDWMGAGQMAQRFELSLTLVNTMPKLLQQRLDAPATLAHPNLKQLMSTLSPNSQTTVKQAKKPAQALALLLSSPEFMYG